MSNDEKKRVEFLTTKDIATVLKVSRQTVRTLCRKGRLPYYVFGKRTVRFLKHEVENAICHMHQAGAQPQPENQF